MGNESEADEADDNASEFTFPPIPEGVPHHDQPVSLDWYLSAGLKCAILEGEIELATSLLRCVEYRVNKIAPHMDPADLATTQRGISSSRDAIRALEAKRMTTKAPT